MTIKEAADYLKIHWQTVRNYVQTGKVKAAKVGRRVRILESDLENWLQNKTKEDVREVEIRFMTNDRKKLERNLLKMGAKIVYQGHVIDHWYVPNEIKNMEQKNEWFDSARGFGLRVREQDNGYSGKITATLEVKRLATPNHHEVCIEQELGIDSYDEADKLLRLMNQKEMTVLDKDRLVYKIGNVKVVIDDIKNFKVGVEIEEMTTEDPKVVVPRLKKLAEKIGLNIKQEITDKSVTYLYMLEYSRF